MKFRDWHTVTTGSACWKRMLLSICCVWANTCILFPIHLGLAISIFFTSALSRSLPCCHANKVWRKHHLAVLCTIRSPGLGTLKTSLAPQSELSQQYHFCSAEVHHFRSLMIPSATYSATIPPSPAWHLHKQTGKSHGGKTPNKHWIKDWGAKSCTTSQNVCFCVSICLLSSCSCCLPQVAPKRRQLKPSSASE